MRSLAVLLAAVLAGVALAQPPRPNPVQPKPLVVTLQLPFPEMPSRLQDWIESEHLIRILVRNTNREQGYENLILSFRILREQQLVARSKDGHPAQPRWKIGPGQMLSLRWRDVVSLEAIEYEPTLARQALTTGELPEGRYQLCVLVSRLPMIEPLSESICNNFAVRSCCPTPIALRAPADNSTQTGVFQFEWTSCTGVVPPQGYYRLVCAPRWQGQTRAQAIGGNTPVLDRQTLTPSYTVTLTEWEQLCGVSRRLDFVEFVWQVTPYRDRVPCARPSDIWGFRVRCPGGIEPTEVKGERAVIYEVKSAKADTVTAPVLSWTVPYPELLTGRPVKLTGTVPAEDTLLYSLHLQMPERIGPDQRAVLMGKGSPSTEPLRVNGMKYRGGYFVYREPPKYRGGFFVYGGPSDTGAGGREPIPIEIVPLKLRTYGGPSDTGAGGSVQRKINPTRYSGYFVYRLPSDTTQPAPLDTIVYYNSVASQIRRDTCCLGATGQTILETRPEVSVGGTFVPLTLGLHLADVVLVGDFGSEPVGGFAQDDQGSVLPGDPVRLWWAKRPGDTPQLLAVGAIHRDGVRFLWAGKRTLSPGSQVEVDVFPLNTALSLGAIPPVMPLFGIFDCDDECGPAGAVRNRRIEITYTSIGWTPGERERVIAWATFLTYLPRQSPGAGRIGREILRVLPFLAMTRGFDVWVRVCCERCEDTRCWYFGSNREWVAHCSPWSMVLTVDGLINVGSAEGLNRWQPVSCNGRPCTWEDIRRRVEEAASRIPCP